MHEDEGEGERGTEDGRGEGRGGGLALRSAMEIPRAYRTRLNVSLEETREDDFSLSSSLPPPPLFATLDHQMRGYRALRSFETRVRSLTFACYYAAI